MVNIPVWFLGMKHPAQGFQPRSNGFCFSQARVTRPGRELLQHESSESRAQHLFWLRWTWDLFLTRHSCETWSTFFTQAACIDLRKRSDLSDGVARTRPLATANSGMPSKVNASWHEPGEALPVRRLQWPRGASLSGFGVRLSRRGGDLKQNHLSSEMFRVSWS